MNKMWKSSAVLALSAVILLTVALPASAHCDAEDGPVITEARLALDKGEVAPILKWISPDDEPTIRALFAQVVEVRAGGDAARTIADQLFFETLVRLHRASEGAPFDGIKPAGHQEPFIKRVDDALAAGEGDAVADAISGHVRQEIASRFEAATRAAGTKDVSTEAGRAYVASYVELVHFIKGIHEAIERGGKHDHAAASHAAHGGAR